MKIYTLKQFSSYRLVLTVCLWIILGGALCSGNDICGPEEEWCTLLDENEKIAYEAIRALHRQLDDNNDGSINLDESDDFLREELMYEKDYEKRQKVFHSNNDQQVSIRELWETWVKSEVHNWTVEQTLEWLGTFVSLPQYEASFTKNAINGTFLPRLAVNHQQFLSSNLGVKDLIHRQKIALKAQDVVLFGPPKDYGNRTKDIILSSLLGVAIIVCWFVYRRYKSSQRDLNKMIKDMESLAKAEKELLDLQREMEKTKAEKQTKIEESPSHRPSVDLGIHASASDELLNLRDEVEVLRSELQRAELELQDKCWIPPPSLQHWLQLTYELELKSYNKKKQAAEKQLRQAKDACDKLKKKRSSLMGAFVSTHGRSIDDVDKAISEARASLTDVTQELQERMHRWKQIEMLVNCPIMNNAGLSHLESILRTYGKMPSFGGLGSGMSNSQDDIDDDGASSIYCPSAVHKLVSQSTYMMYPAHQTPHSVAPFPRSCSYQSQSPDLPSPTSAGCYGGMPTSSSTNGTSRFQPFTVTETPRLVQEGLSNAQHSIPQSQSDSPIASVGRDVPSEQCSIVSVPVTRNYQAPIIRSKSVSNMSSLRTNNSNELPSKDFSNLEDELAGEPFEMRPIPRDRRVTFGIQDSDKGVSVGKKHGDDSYLKSNAVVGDCNGLSSIAKSTETSSSNNGVVIERKDGDSSAADRSASKDEPDLIKLPANRNLNKNSEDFAQPENAAQHGPLATQTLPSIDKVSLNSTNGHRVFNEKKSSVWKRFSTFVSKGHIEQNIWKRNSSKSRHKVFSSDQINSSGATQPTFIKNDLSPLTEKK